ncbi:hypothetical protein BJP36_01325 [Moorena producens JHB]|uniref:FtsH ternary system domain-containing protein n=1 Tax=Moorena producens (strain JHB) TaxID=1454205 RepID=A0A1D9FTN7_MOOP1|nr:hypothetical protein [Moorena producens]AOY78731.1 hypothetical protein BJP36_01325 [Moorena producens JHB]
MDVKVIFRFNKVTGEVEIFQVDDQGRMSLPEAEHNREHDRIAAELGNIIERNPQIMEVFPNNIQPDLEPIPESANTDEEGTGNREQGIGNRQ